MVENNSKLMFAHLRSIKGHDIIQFCLYTGSQWHYIDIETNHFSDKDWKVYEEMDMHVFGEDYFKRNIDWFLEQVNGN